MTRERSPRSRRSRKRRSREARRRGTGTRRGCDPGRHGARCARSGARCARGGARSARSRAGCRVCTRRRGAGGRPGQRDAQGAPGDAARTRARHDHPRAREAPRALRRGTQDSWPGAQSHQALAGRGGNGAPSRAGAGRGGERRRRARRHASRSPPLGGPRARAGPGPGGDAGPVPRARLFRVPESRGGVRKLQLHPAQLPARSSSPRRARHLLDRSRRRALAHAHVSWLGARDGGEEAAAPAGVPGARLPRRAGRRQPHGSVPSDGWPVRGARREHGRFEGDAGHLRARHLWPSGEDTDRPDLLPVRRARLPARHRLRHLPRHGQGSLGSGPLPRVRRIGLERAARRGHGPSERVSRRGL